MSLYLNLPDPLTGGDKGSFAHDTVVRRLPEIVSRVLRENRLTPAAVKALEQLAEELPNGRIRQLEDSAAGQAEWREAIAQYEGNDWLQVPWFFAETYFYRRILEATGFFRPGAGHGQDPFAYQKRLGLETASLQIAELSTRQGRWIEAGWSREVFAKLVATDLWGNQADLSLWPAESGDKPIHRESGQQQDHLIEDNTEYITDHLEPDGQSRTVDFIADNAGFELVCDLSLADYLLSCGVADTVRLHLKAHPTFVSDATVVDVRHTVSALLADDDREVREFASRLTGHLSGERLLLTDYAFWTSPMPAWEMPKNIRSVLGVAHLVISKGDANYRRLLGDLHWPFTTPFAEIVSYFPAPLVSLRTLKSEVASGLSEGLIRSLGQRDENWLTNGRWGMIQWAPGN